MIREFKEFKEFNGGGWIHLMNESAIKNKKDILKELKKEKHGTIGKYLFFSDDRDLLVTFAKKILKKYLINHAKISLLSNNKEDGFDFVLCIYDSSPKLKNILKSTNPKIKYRYWKSDKDTLENKYSKEFLSNKNGI